MSTLRDRSLISVEDVYKVCCQVTLQDTEMLDRIQKRLSFFIDSQFLESDVVDCLCNAKEALEGLIEGSVADTELGLHSLGQNLKCAVEIVKGEPVDDEPESRETAPATDPMASAAAAVMDCETAKMIADSVRAPAPEIPLIVEEPINEIPVIDESVPAPVIEIPTIEEPVAEPVSEIPTIEEPVAAPVNEIPTIEEPVAAPANEIPTIEEPEGVPAFFGLPCLTREDIMGPEDETTAAPEEPEKQDAAITEFILSADLDLELLNEYIMESLDHIDASEGAMLDIETEPDNLEAINTIFRAFHTIKGTSGFLGLPHIQEMAHLAETLLSSARDGELKLTGGYADLILESCDVLKSLVKVLDGAAPGSTVQMSQEYKPMLRKLKNPHETAALAPEVPRVGDILVAEGKVTRGTIEDVADRSDGKRIGEVLVESGQVKVKDVAQALRTQGSLKKAQAADATIRVATGRLDSLIDMVGELVIAQSMVSQDSTVIDGGAPRLTKNVAHASKIVRELQDLTMGLRMVPLKGIFQKMTRLVRDLSRKSDKKVRFISAGEDTELDRNMVEALSDPLVHMIRNSVDHGLELASERVANGKSEQGTVSLRAYQSAGNVMIELVDDGKGLDREKIIAKAIKNGLISNGANLSDMEIFNMIFAPGFSTADQITDVSGRGVGMDVVRKRIDSLRGKVDVQSVSGQGTTITLSLPLTMAITDSMIIKIGEERYLLPTISIEQSIRPESKALFSVTGRGEMVLLRGDLIPVVRLNALFGFEKGVTEIDEGLLICVEAEGKRCALMVDELLGQQQVVVKSLGDWLGEIPGVSGGTILGDGRVGLILDVASLLKIAHAGADTKSSSAELYHAKKDEIIATKQPELTTAVG